MIKKSKKIYSILCIGCFSIIFSILMLTFSKQSNIKSEGLPTTEHVSVITTSNEVSTEFTEPGAEPKTQVTEPTTEPDTKQIEKPNIKLKRPKVKVRTSYEKHVKLTWKKVKKAKCYIVYRKSGATFKKIKETKKTSFTDKKAKKRKTYQYSVVAVTKASGFTFQSKKSKKKSVYVKPKTPTVIVSGECFVEGMKIYAKSNIPKNFHLVYKVGISTYGILNSNYIKYHGMTLTALERIAYYRPDRVIFLVGMNEAQNWNTTSTINNYKKMIQLLKKVSPHVEIVLLALPPVAGNHSSGFAGNRNINHYNEAYKKLAKQTKNVYYYSGYRRLITDKNGQLMPYANGGDGGHWSSKATINVVNDLKKYSIKLTKGKVK